ncbi:Protein of unknown function [Collimonas sp. OK307]|nr:Protein of unknown function [Collimonas sp. OK307]
MSAIINLTALITYLGQIARCGAQHIAYLLIGAAGRQIEVDITKQSVRQSDGHTGITYSMEKKMKALFISAAVAAALLTSVASYAQAPAAAPAGTTGMCKDGTYSSNATKKGACAGHKGVKDWYAAAPAAAAAAPAAAAAAPAATAPAAAPAAMAKPAPAAAPAAMGKPAAAAKTPAAGGGPGQVWVNTSSKVYHCQGSKYYGTTKVGSYMTEAAAKAAGAHADHGKACS